MPRQALAQARHLLVPVVAGDVQELVGGVLHRLHHLRMRMAGAAHGDAGGEVEEAVAVDVPDLRCRAHATSRTGSRAGTRARSLRRRARSARAPSGRGVRCGCVCCASRVCRISCGDCCSQSRLRECPAVASRDMPRQFDGPARALRAVRAFSARSVSQFELRSARRWPRPFVPTRSGQPTAARASSTVASGEQRAQLQFFGVADAA